MHVHAFRKKKEQQVGGFNPFERKLVKIGSFPQLGMKIKHILNHHLVLVPQPEYLSGMKIKNI